VLAELVRTRDHLDLPLKLHFWRTKEGEEIDFLVAVHGPGRPRWIAIEATFSNQQVDAMAIPPALAREFSDLHEIWIVTPGGTETRPVSPVAAGANPATGGTCARGPTFELLNY
jgi:hypothetical protein